METEAKERAEWKARIGLAVLQREFDDETLIAMVFAGFDKAHSEGLQDAAYVCDKTAEGVADPAKKQAATVLGNSIRKLDKINTDGNTHFTFSPAQS